MIAAAMPAIVQVVVGTSANDGDPQPETQGTLGDGLQRERPDEKGAIGSGFIISSDGVAVTNAHVVSSIPEVGSANGPQLAVRLVDGSLREAILVGRDPKTDLAVLRLAPSAKPYPVLTWGESERIRVGDDVVAVGSPFGLGGSASAGIISGRGRVLGNGPYDDYFQIDAAINPGNSGGPLLDRTGHVIGINTALYSPTGASAGIGFSIPSSVAHRVIGELLKQGQIRHAGIGVEVQGVSADIADALGLRKPAGALIISATPDGPAAKAGLRTGDVILAIDGQPISQFSDLSSRVASLQAEHEVHIGAWRDAKPLAVTLVAMAAPDPGLQALDLAKLSSSSPFVTFAGLRLSSTTSELNRIAGQASDLRGLMVISADTTSLAKQRGMAEGDIVIAIGGKPVTATTDVTETNDAAKAAGRHNLLLSVARGAVVRVVVLPVQ